MEYRQSMDWRLSEIGLGCYGLSGAYGKVEKGAFAATIRHAFEQGVNFFDTAQGYGEAESFLGDAVAPFRDQVYIATKLSGDSGVTDLSTRGVRQACEGSLRRLKTDLIDLYQIHFDDPDTPVLETVTALESLVEAGKIRRFGVCHLPAHRCLEYAEAGDLFSILMELSPVARTATKTLLPICVDYGLAAFAFSVTGRGILSGRYAPGHEFAQDDIRRMDPLFKRERFESALRVRAYLGGMGEGYGCTAVQAGIAWVLAQPQVACALTGTASPAHLDENLAASEISLEENDLAALNQFLVDEEARLANAQADTIRQLLKDPLSNIPEQAFNDLVYVMEAAVMMGKLREGDLIPAFQELFALRKTLDQSALKTMRGIQHHIRTLLFDPQPPLSR